MKSDRLAAILLIFLALAYPALVYFGLKTVSSKTVAMVLGILLMARLALVRDREHRRRVAMMLLPPLVLCAIAVLVNRHEFILYLPVFFSLVFFVSFGITLFGSCSAVETFARMVVSELSPDEIAHCRRVTQIWVVFFVVNGIIAFWTAAWGSLKAWGLYNGLVAYLVMGVLFAGELTYRHWRFRRYVGLPTDRFFRKFFPPKS